MSGPFGSPLVSPRHSFQNSRNRSHGSHHGASYRRDSLASNFSALSDVEMAQEEVFSGPISESVPSSVTGFANRRHRSESLASFTYFQEEDESPNWAEDQAIIEDDESFEGPTKLDDFDEALDLESGGFHFGRHKSSSVSHAPAESQMLLRQVSTESDTSESYQDRRRSQKVYIASEDLTIVVAGFNTRSVGYFVYLGLCIATLGICYLVFRWLPNWRVRLVGSSETLHDCQWVVIENQWGEMSIQKVSKFPYGFEASTVFGARPSKTQMTGLDDEDDPIISDLVYLDYRYLRLYFHPHKDKFLLCNDWIDPAWTSIKSLKTGLDSEERSRRELVFSRNLIDIEEKTMAQLLVEEVLHPFYVFQIASLILWSLDQYYYYAVCIFLISLISITTTLIETRATMKRLREVSRYECEVRVMRNGFWRSVPSSELVPGDIYEISDPELTLLPCDSLLLSGDCIINESMLTGESVPVSKFPATNESLPLLANSATMMRPELAKHFLFSGTKIIRARRPQGGQDESAALAVVIRTGFNTTKGSLVRSMLFPKPSGFKFYQDAFRYISVMAAIAGIGFIASLINFIRLHLAWHLIVVRALDLITIVVPPALPATLTIGINFALSRLKVKRIYCISPQRINVAGKLDVVCFDKTGTLTEDGLDIFGLRAVNRPAMHFSDILENASALLPRASYERDPTVDYRIHQAILFTMATCHSLRSVDGNLLGDPLDVKMFEFTGWSFDEISQKALNDDDIPSSPSSIVRSPIGSVPYVEGSDFTEDTSLELGILKAFEFVSQLRRASVVVAQAGTKGGSVYVKGAPESMKDICLADSLPPDYEDLLGYYTHRGFRVIACATKHIRSLDWPKVKKLGREDAESGLTFLGFIVFENRLKSTTINIIEDLNAASIRSVMCTGDNILTAISVARECSLLQPDAYCFTPQYVEGDHQSPKARLKWQSVDNPALELDEHTLVPLRPLDISQHPEVPIVQDYALAISGDIFRWIIEYANEEIVKRMLARGQIFARMSPDEKHELVEKLQSIDYCCGFCGDGANDCGALKAADVGISLSEAEASVAAPFTSREFDISCVPEIIREGRAALVTSFCCFKYMSLYSAIQFVSVSFLYASASNLGDFQYLFIDIFLVLPVAIFMGWTGPYPILSRKRPMASLVSRKVLTPLIGQIALSLAIQAVAFIAVRKQSWFIPPFVDTERSNIENSENTALFGVSSFQYIYSGVVLSLGPPFRQSMEHNLPFVVTVVATTLICTYLLMDPASWLRNLMQFTPTSFGFKIFILCLACGGFSCALFGERTLFPKLAQYVRQTRLFLRPRWKKRRKEYKLVLEDMRI